MAREVFLRNAIGKIKKGRVGFSWTVLFFGAFVPLLRGDFVWFLIMFFVNFMSVLASHAIYNSENAAIATSLIFLIIQLFFCFKYNQFYTQKLVEKGFLPVDETGKIILQEYGVRFVE